MIYQEKVEFCSIFFGWIFIDYTYFEDSSRPRDLAFFVQFLDQSKGLHWFGFSTPDLEMWSIFWSLI